MIILENLVSEGYDESPELYEKFFAQLRKTSSNLNTKLVHRTLSIVAKYQEIAGAGKSQQIADLAQFYIDRFNDSVKIVEK
jgi:DNA-binding MurR/RpiR family transcriptional regulator